MRTYLATVLSVIAAGVVLIAYGLLAPRPAISGSMPVTYDAQAGTYDLARPISASERIPAAAANAPLAYTAAAYQPAAPTYRASDVRVPRVTTSRQVTRHAAGVQGRDWKRTALVIGGSTAGGAGLGAIVAGKKGALIGAALGGGASTLFEALRK